MRVARNGDKVRIFEWNLTDAIVCVVYRASRVLRNQNRYKKEGQ